MATNHSGTDVKSARDFDIGQVYSRSNNTPSDTSLEKDNSNVKHTSSDGQNVDLNFEGDPSRQHATFVTIGDKKFYKPIDLYEGRHRYDPNFQWEPQEEKKLVRKVRSHTKMPDPMSQIVLTVAARFTNMFVCLPDVLCSPTR